MRQTALNSSSNGFYCYFCTCQSDQEEEEDESDSKQLTKSNSKLDVLISSHYNHLQPVCVQSQIWRQSDYWRWRCLCEELKAIDSLLPSYEGSDCYMREIVGTLMQRWQCAIFRMPWIDREKIKESYKPRGRLLGHKLCGLYFAFSVYKLFI